MTSLRSTFTESERLPCLVGDRGRKAEGDAEGVADGGEGDEASHPYGHSWPEARAR